MAFRYIPGNSQYEYDNDPPDPGVGHPMRALWQKSANGIRTEHGQSNYVRCRRIGSGDVDHGEISKSYWDLRSSVSLYGILAFEPSFILDFKASVFNKNDVSSTFGASITHAATTNATMVDSDGLLKWRPHNLAKYSEDFSNSYWNAFGARGTMVANATTAPDGTTTADKIMAVNADTTNGAFQNATPVPAGGRLSVFAKADTVDWLGFGEAGDCWAYFDLANGVTGNKSTTVGSTSITAYPNGWYLCEAYDITTDWSRVIFCPKPNEGNGDPWSNVVNAAGDSAFLWGAHITHRDLGGMVNNPDRGDSYVPTTTTPVYLSRRGHHIYNGSAWVNEGILHESEARTNLMTYSGDLAGADWSGGGSTIGAVTSGSPFGTYHTFSPSASGSTPAIRRQLGKPATSGATYVGWSLVKYSVGSGWFAISMHDTGKGDERAWFDLQNGVVGTKEPLIIDHGMVDYGDGWWLCWSSANAASTSAGCAVNITNGDGVFSRTQTDIILIAGTQFELGTTPSSYIPTTTATITRAAETLTVPAANLPYNSTNMSIQIDGKMTYTDNNSQFEVSPYRWLQNATNYIMSLVITTGSRTGQPILSQRHGTSGYDAITGGNNTYAPGTNVPFNMASRNVSTFINGAHEGTLLTANTTPTILPDLSATDLFLGYIFMGTIGQFRMWSDDITDAGITEATLPSTEPSLSLTFDGSENSFIVLDWSE